MIPKKVGTKSKFSIIKNQRPKANGQGKLGMTTIFVTHDVGVAAEISDRVAVMYAGRIVEQGPVSEVLLNPRHPYTKGLLDSTVHGSLRGKRIQAISGAPPDLANLPKGCAFAPRCQYARPVCADDPPVVNVAEDHSVRCARTELKLGQVFL